jgi:hypothetical protein
MGSAFYGNLCAKYHVAEDLGRLYNGHIPSNGLIYPIISSQVKFLINY